MPYTPPDNDAVNFSEEASYSPPSNDAVNFSEEADGQTTSASGTVTVTGSASPTVTQRASASGSVTVTGNYTKIFRPTASGTVTVTGSASATVAVKASASGAVSVVGAASPTIDGFGPIEDVASDTFLKLVNPADATDTVVIPDDAFEFIEGTQNREHTAVKDWGISVKPRDDSLTDRVFDKIVLVHRGIQFGVGRLLRVDPDYSDEEMALEGYGRLYEMRTEPARKIYKDTPYFRAIDDFLGDAETVDAYTVVEPTPQTVLNDEETVNAPAVDGFDDLGAEITSTTPIDIDATGGVSTQQTLWSEYYSGNPGTGNFVDGEGSSLVFNGDSETLSFSPTYDVPETALGIALRFESEDDTDGEFKGVVEVRITGGQYTDKVLAKYDTDLDPTLPSVQWVRAEQLSSGLDAVALSSDNTNYDVTVEVVDEGTDTSRDLLLDAIVVFDERFSYDFDDTTDANDQLAGPELYPDAVEAVLVDKTLGSNIETVDVSSTFVDSEAGRWALSVGSQTLEATDGDANPTFDADANDAYGTGLQLLLELGRKGSRTSTSPTEGFEPEDLTDLVVNVTTNDLRVIQGQKDYLGTEFDVLKQLCDESRYRFRTDPKADLGVVDIEAFRPEDRRSQPGLEWQDSLSASVDAFDYFNAARGLGRRRVGDRISAERAVDEEIAEKGVRVGKAKTFSRAIADKAELRTELEKYLSEGVSNYNRDLSGTAYLQDIQPGGEVYVPIRDEFIPLERVRVDFASETMDVEFDYTDNDANAAATLNAAEETETRQSIGLDDKKSVKDAFGLDDSAFTDEDEGGEEAKQPKEEGASGDFGVSINSTNSPVEEYDTVEVKATVTNNDTEDAQEGRFVFSVGGTRQEVKNRTVGAGESVDLTFAWATSEGDAGDYTAAVESGTDSASTGVTVEGFPEPSGDFGVSINSTNSPRQEGEVVLVTADIVNNKASSQTGTFVLNIDGTPISYREGVAFGADETQSLTFAWTTEDGDAGDHTAEVASGTASDSTTVIVEKSDGAADPGAFSVFIESAPSKVSHPDGDATVTAGVHYNGSVSASVIVSLEEDAPGSFGSTADFNEIMIGPGETRTLSLTWDRVDLVPDYFVPGDVQLCVEADRDGVSGIQDEATTSITVVQGLGISGSASDDQNNDISSTKVADSGEVADADSLVFYWEFTANDTVYGDKNDGGLYLSGTNDLDDEFFAQRGFSANESGSGEATLDISGRSTPIYLVVDDGDGSVSPP